MKNIRQYIKEAILYLRRNFPGQHKDLPYYLLIFFAFLFFVFGINFFIELTESLSGAALKSYDDAVTDYIVSFRTPALTHFFQVITDMGDLYGYMIATALIAIVVIVKFRNWQIIVQLMAVTILAALSNLALKRVINRARPEIEHLVVVKSLSYPSGHSMSAMAFYGFLIYLTFRIKMPRWLRWLLCLVFLFLILAIGLSRIYLGVHFPSDVLGGFTAGLIWVAFCIVLFNIIDMLRRRRSSKTHPKEDSLEE